MSDDKPEAALDRQMRLHMLCRQLLQRRDVVTSGRMQLIGLGKIRKRAGDDWPALQKIVYDTVEAVLEEGLAASDLSFRYGDDGYLVLFADLQGAEAEAKAAAIVDTVRQRLYAANAREFSEFEITNTVGILEARDFIAPDGGFAWPAALQAPAPVAEDVFTPPTVEVDARPAAGVMAEEDLGLSFSYQPIWEIGKAAVTSFLALPRREAALSAPLQQYAALYSTAGHASAVDYDLRVLEQVRRDLLRLARENKQTMIVCPVRFQTMRGAESVQKYIHRCATIPEALRKYLILILWDMPAILPPHEPFWFVPRIRRKLCRATYANIARPQDLVQPGWRGSGIDGFSLVLPENPVEEAAQQEIDRFCVNAKALSARTAILNAASRSIVSMSIGSGADYVAGDVIAPYVAAPEAMYRFRYEFLYPGVE